MNSYSLKMQVRFSDYDSQKVVNHTKIYALIEAAYTSFFSKKINKHWNPDFMPLSLRTSNTDFLIPIKHGASPICVLDVREIGVSSFTLSITIIDEKTKKIYVKSTRVFVFINIEIHRPKPIAEKEKMNLNKFLRDVNI